MKVFVVYAHPEPKSFNGALKDAAVATLSGDGHEVVVTDLYAEGFNPVAGRHDFLEEHDPELFHYQREQAHAADGGGFAPELGRDQERLYWCDLLILVFPLWWQNVSAILKGWIDRVLAYRITCEVGISFDKGFFKGRRGLVCVTTGGTPERFSEGGIYGPIEPVLRPITRGVIGYLGMEALPPFVAYAAPRVDDAARKKYLANWSVYLREVCNGERP